MSVETEPKPTLKVTQIICIVCGRCFTSTRSDALYCGNACGSRARAARRSARIKCAGCGSLFMPTVSSQKYCTRDCRRRAERRRRYARQQQQQGRTVNPRGARSARPRLEAQRCFICRTIFVPGRVTQRYCSADCRRRASNISRAASNIRTAARCACEAIARLHVPDMNEICIECGHEWPCETYRISSSVVQGG